MITCKTCNNYTSQRAHRNGFAIGLCEREPFQCEQMTSVDIAVECGHDGGISVGEDFGCIFHKSKQ